ncbi:uncharacterized protein LOC123316358 [Coccinella septempunctata]|uniref:uncharacterized protein LOC123316358 n=1 Tax=Coccinella septempunctata TaxID=41139 RepID=UPI001D06AD50|nr:uncharacterized protein LOC123316358 [Coccinella septempunctata]
MSIMYTVLPDIIKQMMKERNIEQFKFFIDGGTNNQDGYMGEIVFFHVVTNNNERLNLVLKSAKAQEDLKNILSADILYERELNMYTIVIPTLKNFAERNNLLEMDKFIPRLWFAEKHSNQVNIVLENLKLRNFHIHDRRKPMDSSHMKVLFETYGKWHGISMAFRDQYPRHFSKLLENWMDPRLKLIQSFGLVKLYKKELGIIKRMLAERERDDLLKIFDGVENEIESILFRKNLDQSDSLIISHGDNWSNNYLFKYEGSDGDYKPNQVYLLDFQLSRLDSPALELSSTLYNMGDRHVFADFNNLLTIYHKSLTETLKILGSDAKVLFAMDDLKRHWKKYGLFSVLNSFVYLRIALCEAEEAPDLSKMAENGEDLDGAFSFETKNMQTFWQRVLDIFIHYAEFCNQLSIE